ncbi:MAG: Flp pilus assembly protein CpaB [Cyanobacteria bacterium HKST-UBA03]|nr:Flp pilus assembly protein CpaB [Cyanobacteria bacterium HKST-UBA03]
MGQVFIILGLLSAVLTVILFRGMSTPPAEEMVETPTKPLVIATHSIPKGQAIQNDDVKVVEWPEDVYPKVEVYENTKSLVGRIATSDILAGQPIFMLNLAKEGTRGGLTTLIPNGFRAITISVTESKAVAGFIKPGDHVDVLATFEIRVAKEAKEGLPVIPFENTIPLTDTVVQDIPVLAIAQEVNEKELPHQSDEEEAKTDKDDKKKGGSGAKIVSTLTLAVTPEQAEKIAFSEEKGVLKVVLRNQSDKEQPRLIGTVTGDIVDLVEALTKAGGPPRKPEPKAEPEAPVVMPISPYGRVEVIEGTESTTVSF